MILILKPELFRYWVKGKNNQSKHMQTTIQNKELTEAWASFLKTKSLDFKHKLLMNYIWLVKYVLNQMHLPNNTILEEEDFLNVGIIGLNETIERFEPERGVKFESYAIPRIKGIIQDELRKLDWLSRTARKKAHEILSATDELRSKKGREVSSEEVMNKLGLTPVQYESYLAAAAAAKASISLNESQQVIHNDEEMDILEEFADPGQNDYLENIGNEERISFLSHYIEKLNERKKLVVSLYYYEELTFKEIGQVLNVSESRVCQIHTQVINDLRKKLNELEND